MNKRVVFLVRLSLMVGLALIPVSALAVTVDVTPNDGLCPDGSCNCPGNRIACPNVAYTVTVSKAVGEPNIRSIDLPVDCSKLADITFVDGAAAPNWKLSDPCAGGVKGTSTKIGAVSGTGSDDVTTSVSFTITLNNAANGNKNSKQNSTRASGSGGESLTPLGKAIPTIIPSGLQQAPSVTTWGLIALVALLLAATAFLVARRRSGTATG